MHGIKRKLLLAGLICFAVSANAEDDAANYPTRVFFGDTHLHTSYSPDAYLMQNRSADPDTAYRYARGLPVVHPYHRAKIQIGTPLDFLVVADHGEFMGVVPRLLQGDPLVANTETGKRYRKMFDEYTSDGGHPNSAEVERRLGQGLVLLLCKMFSEGASPSPTFTTIFSRRGTRCWFSNLNSCIRRCRTASR